MDKDIRHSFIMPALKIMWVFIVASCGSAGGLGDPSVTQADRDRAAVQAIHGLLDSYGKGMMDNDIDLLETILSEAYLDSEGKDKYEKLAEWTGPFPPALWKCYGFNCETAKYFRLLNREISLEGDIGRVLCTEDSHWVNNGYVMRETRARKLRIGVQREVWGAEESRESVWRVISLDNQGEYGTVWTDEYWYPSMPSSSTGCADFYLTTSMYDDEGIPVTLPSSIQLGQEPQWQTEPCVSCSEEEKREGARNCCSVYCLKHQHDCLNRFADDLLLSLCCMSTGCLGARVTVPDDPGLGALGVALMGEDERVIPISHRFRIVDWSETDWDHLLLGGVLSKENSIRSVCLGPDNAIWFGSVKTGRIYRCAQCGESPELILDLEGGVQEKEGIYAVQTITADKKYLWCGIAGFRYEILDGVPRVTDRTGKVLRFDGSSWEAFENIFGEGKDSSVFDSLADGKGGVWFAGEGVRYWNGHEQDFTRYYSRACPRCSWAMISAFPRC